MAGLGDLFVCSPVADHMPATPMVVCSHVGEACLCVAKYFASAASLTKISWHEDVCISLPLFSTEQKTQTKLKSAVSKYLAHFF